MSVEAVAEALPVFTTLLVFMFGILLGAYFIFARAWIQYQSEQALYCMAEGRLSCRQQLRTKLKAALPFGEEQRIELSSQNDLWKTKVEWKIQGYKISVMKDLSARALIRSKALRW